MTPGVSAKFASGPKPTPKFEDDRRRYHDGRFEETLVKVLPGDHYVTSIADEMIVTVLGSCVCACIRDPLIAVGGMNHFMLPRSESGAWGGVTESMRYGNFAMERLINDILARGGQRRRLEIKVFGGANVLKIATAVGRQNAEFVEKYLAEEGLPIAASHLNGIYPRRIHYVPHTGKVQMLELRRAEDVSVIEVEHRYSESLKRVPLSGSIELFD